MNWLFLIFLLIFLLVFVTIKSFVEKNERKNINKGYRLRNAVLNKSEKDLFFELQKQYPDYHIFPKMRIADILETLNGKGYYKRRNLILPKHIDFLICDKNFKPVLAIELDGKSHLRKDRRERDILVDSIFENVGLKLHRISTSDNFSNQIMNIKRF